MPEKSPAEEPVHHGYSGLPGISVEPGKSPITSDDYNYIILSNPESAIRPFQFRPSQEPEDIRPPEGMGFSEYRWFAMNDADSSLERYTLYELAEMPLLSALTDDEVKSLILRSFTPQLDGEPFPYDMSMLHERSFESTVETLYAWSAYLSNHKSDWHIPDPSDPNEYDYGPDRLTSSLKEILEAEVVPLLSSMKKIFMLRCTWDFKVHMNWYNGDSLLLGGVDESGEKLILVCGWSD